MPEPSKYKQQTIALFGHFGAGNVGNDCTLQAMLQGLGRLLPDAAITCICTGPERISAQYQIATVPMSGVVVKPWPVRNLVARLTRRLFIGIPGEIYRWYTAIITLRGTDMVIVPGTGLLTDAFSLFGWGPYSTFKWAVAAKLGRAKLVFVSMGAGPIYSRAGRFCVKAALRLADFRSYRDEASQRYLKGIGFPADKDPVYPDLAFSLSESLLPSALAGKSGRLVVGLGLMEHAGKYGVEKPRNVDNVYLETLAEFVKWLLAHDYNIRLLIGDLVDPPVVREFKDSLAKRSVTPEPGRIIDEPIASVSDLLVQLAATDFVVATRFHNVLLALLLNKPAIAISFHHKCSSLMAQMGLSEYCEDINDLRIDRLIEQFRRLEDNAGNLKQIIAEKVKAQREALDEQYRRIFGIALPSEPLEHAQVRAGTNV